MITYPNPKINIGLYITKKREDGFHNIETVFFPVYNVTDVLEINPVNDDHLKISVHNFDENLDNNDNLCAKAYYLLKQQFNIQFVEIILTKNIPVGAGLGGGSSDAAFTLIMLNNIFNLNLSKTQLKYYASLLGSDVAFFIDNCPSLATGKGEILEPVELDLSNFEIKIVPSHIKISSAEAYKNIVPQAANINLKNIAKMPVKNWKNIVFNRFENNMFKIHPLLSTIKQNLYKENAIYASMSGSGSAIYGIFER